MNSMELEQIDRLAQLSALCELHADARSQTDLAHPGNQLLEEISLLAEAVLRLLPDDRQGLRLLGRQCRERCGGWYFRADYHAGWSTRTQLIGFNKHPILRLCCNPPEEGFPEHGYALNEPRPAEVRNKKAYLFVWDLPVTGYNRMVRVDPIPLGEAIRLAPTIQCVAREAINWSASRLTEVQQARRLAAITSQRLICLLADDATANCD